MARILAAALLVAGQHGYGLAMLVALLQRDGMVDGIFGHLRRGSAGSGKVRFGDQGIARLHRQIAGRIGQRRIIGEVAPRRLGQRARTGDIARMQRHAHAQQRAGGIGRRRGRAHLLRSQPVTAIRPTGANGGT